REGYAGQFYDFLQSIRSGNEFLTRIRPDSDKSGAAMRSVPLGVFPTVDEVLDRCRVQAAITHDTSDGIHAAQAAALMSHYFVYRLGTLSQLGAFLESRVPGRWSSPWRDKVGAKGWMSVRAAVTAIVRNNRLT